MFGLARYLLLVFPCYGMLAKRGACSAHHRAIRAISPTGFTFFVALDAGWYFVG